MKALFISFILFINLFALQERQALMDSISEYALRIGTGSNKAYVFVDPLCLRSQAFIEVISNRKDLQKKTSYYIFLYKLPNFNSEKFIVYIYQSPNPLIALEEVMIHENYNVPTPKMTKKTKQKLEAIAKVAKQMNVKKRPYLLLFEEGSKYCRVSEGTAPCLEKTPLIRTTL